MIHFKVVPPSPGQSHTRFVCSNYRRRQHSWQQQTNRPSLNMEVQCWENKKCALLFRIPCTLPSFCIFFKQVLLPFRITNIFLDVVWSCSCSSFFHKNFQKTIEFCKSIGNLMACPKFSRISFFTPIHESYGPHISIK